jgi:hypothetical protein
MHACLYGSCSNGDLEICTGCKPGSSGGTSTSECCADSHHDGPAEAPDKKTLTQLDKLAEEAATLRVGLVLGLGNGKQADSDEEV